MATPLQETLNRFKVANRTNFSTSGPRYRRSQQRLSRRRPGGGSAPAEDFPSAPLAPDVGSQVAESLDEYIARNPAATQPGYVPGTGGGATARSIPIAPEEAPGGSGLTDAQFANLSPDAQDAVRPLQGTVRQPNGNTVSTPVVSGSRGEGLVPAVDPSSGRTVYVDPETAYGSGLDMDDRVAGAGNGGFVGEELALRQRDREAQARFLESDDGRTAARITAGALARGPSDYERASAERSNSITFERELPGFGQSRLSESVPDRRPGELSMADAVDLAGGDRRKARALLVQSRLDGQGGQGGQDGGLTEEERMRLAAELDQEGYAYRNQTENANRLARYQALAKQFDLDIPQNIAQGELVALQVQKKKLSGLANQRESIASEISGLQNEARDTALDQMEFSDNRLGKEVDRLVSDNNVSRRAALEEIVAQGDQNLAPAAQQALAQADQDAAVLLQEGPMAQELGALSQSLQRINDLGSQLAAETPYDFYTMSAEQPAAPAAPTAPAAATPDAQFAEELVGNAPRQQPVRASDSGPGNALLPQQTGLGARRPNNVISLPGLNYGANLVFDSAGNLVDAATGAVVSVGESALTGRPLQRRRPLRGVGEAIGNAIGNALYPQARNIPAE